MSYPSDYAAEAVHADKSGLVHIKSVTSTICYKLATLGNRGGFKPNL